MDVAGLFDKGVPAGGPAAAGREATLRSGKRPRQPPAEIRAQARGEGLNCYGILHSHAPIIPTAPLKAMANRHARVIAPERAARRPAARPCRPLIRFCPAIPAY